MSVDQLPLPEELVVVVEEAEPARASSWHTPGTGSRGETLAFTEAYLLRDDQPVLPIMGEFHAARYPRPFWEEALRKIQAGGISLVATYIFWNYIEEEEGQFDWSEERDIRAFVELCARLNLEVILRPGPFVHGECRNGGLPDWLYARGIQVRASNEAYLGYVARYFTEVGRQVAGLLSADGGPVIGFQIENEYMHAGAPWEVGYPENREYVPAGPDGSAHLVQLLELAREAGLRAPIYTCTAWGGAAVPERDFLPTQSGYAFTPWVLDPEYEQPPTREFLFQARRRQSRVAGQTEYEPARYPLAFSELGSGIQMTYPHRPVVPPACVQAQTIVALGSGANWLGYYMYHGGSHPADRRFYVNEHQTPRLSYDFQAPLGEFGEVNASYHHLRLLHLFLREWGSELAPMEVTLPLTQDRLLPADAHTLRWSVRSRAGAGFLFLNNYQDHVEMQTHQHVQFRVHLEQETVVIPEQTRLRVHSGVSAILPFNLTLAHGVLLKYATAQPLTMLQQDGLTTCVFFALEGMDAEFAFDAATCRDLTVNAGSRLEEQGRVYVVARPGLDCQLTLTALDGAQLQILVLTRDQALTFWQMRLWGEERLLLHAGLALVQDEALELSWLDASTSGLTCYPALPPEIISSARLKVEGVEGVFTHYTLTAPEVPVSLEIEPLEPGVTRIRLPATALHGLGDVFLAIDYLGDIGCLYLEGRLVADNFASERTWQVGLKRFFRPERNLELILRLSPLARADPRRHYLPTKIARSSDPRAERWLELFSLRARPEYRAHLTLQM